MSITVTRLIGYVKPSPPVIDPPPPPQILVVPAFSPQNGAVAFGSVVTLGASSLPNGAILEYSTDNGTSWIAGSQITVNNKMSLLGRVRAGAQLSASTAASFTPYYQRLLIIGNSIMNTAPYPEIGWFNNNGMAASAPEKDYVHLITGHLQTLNSGVGVKLHGSGNFERYYGMSSYSLDELNADIQQFKPDMILVRMGENVEDGEVSARNFESNFRQFLERLASLSGSQPVKIVVTTSVWAKPQTDAVIRKVTNEKGHTLVDLSDIVGKSQYFASEYPNPAVAAHPNDAGMQRMSDMIWEKLK